MDKYFEIIQLLEETVQKDKEKVPEQLIKQAAKGGTIAFFATGAGKVIGLILHVLLARTLGTMTYGVYVLGFSVFTIAKSIASIGLPNGVVRFCSMYRGVGDNEHVKGTLYTAIFASLASSVLIAVITVSSANLIAQKIFSNDKLAGIIQVFAIAIPFYVLIRILMAFAESFRRIEYSQGIENIFLPVTRLLLISVAFMLGFRLYGVLYSFLIIGVIGAAIGIKLIGEVFPQRHKFKAIWEVEELFRFSIPLFFINILAVVLACTDRIMIGYFMNADDVGIYNAASITSLQILVFLSVFLIVFAPLVSDLYNRKKKKAVETLFKTITRWVLILTVPLFLILFLFPKTIVVLLFGQKFGASAVVLPILAVAQLLNASTGPVGRLLQMAGKQNIDFINALALVICNIILNAILIPIYGLPGAAVATGLSLAAIHIVRLIEVKKLLNMHPYNKACIKPLVSGIAALLIGAACIYLLRMVKMNHISICIVSIPAILAAYICILLLMKMEPEDKIVMSALKSKLSGLKKE